MNNSTVRDWFLHTLEQMAATHGAGALARTQLAVRGVPRWEVPFVRIRLSRRLIADHWDEIERHKWMMSEKVGRDVGVAVAALDYFELCGDARAADSSGWLRRLGNFLLRNLDNDGPKSIAAFERAMRGTRSLAH